MSGEVSANRICLAIVLKIVDTFRARRREGPHRFAQKRPPTFVSALRSVATVEMAKLLGTVRFSIFSTLSARSGHSSLVAFDPNQTSGEHYRAAKPWC